MNPKIVKSNQLRHHWEIYFFVIPTLILIALFQYYPASSGIIHSFYRWNGSDISEFAHLDNYIDLFRNVEFWNSFKLAFILGFWNVIKMIPALLVAVCIHRCRSEKSQFLYRTLFVIPMVIPGLITALIWRSFFFEATNGYLNQFLEWSGLLPHLATWGEAVAGYLATPADGGLAYGTLKRSICEMFNWLTAFQSGSSPAWLGDPRLIVIACVIWGFPWVGSFAVLTHLAKLQNISKDVYEAAHIDGVSWWSQFTKIELPLLMGSIYLLLVFAIIDTIKDAGMILALAGIAGGPGGHATVPALFMLRKAFMDQQMGYACAVGIILTIVVLLLQKMANMLLSTGEDDTETKKPPVFGVCFSYILITFGLYLYSYIIPQTATWLSMMFYLISTLVPVLILASVPLFLLKKLATPMQRLPLFALAAGVIYVGILQFEATPLLLLFGFCLMVISSYSPFKTAIGTVGAVMMVMGLGGAHVNMDLLGYGIVLLLISIPWKTLFDKLDRLYLAYTLRQPAPEVSKGDLYVANTFARQQHGFHRATAIAKEWGLRFSKHGFIWFVLASAFLPLYLMIIVSGKTNTQFYEEPTTITQPFHWENWAEAWHMISPTVANSIFLSTSATILIVLFGMGGAYFFARLKVPGSSFLWNALLLLMMMPMIANLVPLFILLRDMNLLNTLQALILVGASGGQAFAIFVFRNFIADIPQDLFEAAEIDGANHFQQLKTVVMPLSGSIMGTVAVMQFLGQWNEFVMPLIVMRDHARLPVTVQLMRIAGEYIKLWGPLMAGYAIASIPVIILFTFSMKLFVKGMTEGAVKG